MLIQSEIGRLKTVLLHRPYTALTRLTPNNCARFLFDDVLWPERAAEEHDTFSALLQAQGVQVLWVERLLKEALLQKQAKDYLIQQCLSNTRCGPRVERLMSQYLHHLTTDELVDQLLSGLTFEELAPYSLELLSTVAKPHDFVIPPLPNQLFTRDTSAWISCGVCINRMAFPARQAETAIVSTIYHYHPLFQTERFSLWYTGDSLDQPLPSIEGGDILVINEDCVAIGLSQRTQPQAVEQLAKTLFSDNHITEILAIELPKTRASMHLDTIFSFVDRDAVCSICPELALKAWSIRAGDKAGDLDIRQEPVLARALERILAIKKLRIIYPTGDVFTLEREQWNDAVNLLAIRPAVVITYEQNKLTNQALKQAGIEVITFAASELSRGRGGSHCMSCPLERESLC